MFKKGGVGVFLSGSRYKKLRGIKTQHFVKATSHSHVDISINICTNAYSTFPLCLNFILDLCNITEYYTILLWLVCFFS